MARGRIIALVGVDGCGKSTQAALLAAALRARGDRARAFENPGGRPVLDALARRLGRADGGALVGARGRVAIELVVRTVAIARAVAWARVTGGTAVMDRYAVCQLATMTARGDRAGFGVGRWLVRVAPAPSLLVWLSVGAAEAQRRVEARGIDHEPLAWLSAFADAYATLLPPAAHVIDAGGSPEVVHGELFALARAMTTGV